MPRSLQRKHRSSRDAPRFDCSAVYAGQEGAKPGGRVARVLGATLVPVLRRGGPLASEGRVRRCETIV